MPDDSEFSNIPKTPWQKALEELDGGPQLRPLNPDEKFYVLTMEVADAIGKLAVEELNLLRDHFDVKEMSLSEAISLIRSHRHKPIVQNHAAPQNPRNKSKHDEDTPSGSKF